MFSKYNLDKDPTKNHLPVSYLETNEFDAKKPIHPLIQMYHR